jgi:hypothetical protein
VSVAAKRQLKKMTTFELFIEDRGFRKLNPAGILKVSFLSHWKGNAVVTFLVRRQGEIAFMMRHGRIPNHKPGRTCTKRASSDMAWL